jgi:hypothetical protein
MKKLVLAITLAAVAVLTVQIQSVAACDFTKSAAYTNIRAMLLQRSHQSGLILGLS